MGFMEEEKRRTDFCYLSFRSSRAFDFFRRCNAGTVETDKSAKKLEDFLKCRNKNFILKEIFFFFFELNEKIVRAKKKQSQKSKFNGF